MPSLRVGAESRVGDLHWGAAGKVAQVTGQPYACAEVCLRERSRKRNRTTAALFTLLLLWLWARFSEQGRAEGPASRLCGPHCPPRRHHGLCEVAVRAAARAPVWLGR